jgi:SOS response regulatory protein OraA/RecX
MNEQKLYKLKVNKRWYKARIEYYLSDKWAHQRFAANNLKQKQNEGYSISQMHVEVYQKRIPKQNRRIFHCNHLIQQHRPAHKPAEE